MAKHYIRLDGIFITKSFSTAFEQPIDGDICVDEGGGRHFNLTIYNDEGFPNLKYIDGEILETTEEDIARLRPIPLDPNLTIEERITQLELMLLESEGYING